MSYPDNASYMVAAYIVAAAVVLSYVAWLYYRTRKLR